MRVDTSVNKKTLIFVHIPKAAGSTMNFIIERQYPQDSIYAIGLKQKNGHTYEEFKAQAEQQRAAIRVLKGHIPYGIHAFLPQPVVYLTVLRDPVERVISEYNYILRSHKHSLHDFVLARKMSLRDYVTSTELPRLDNLHTRYLCGLDYDAVQTEQLSAKHLEAAKRNLQEVRVVGIMERFDETLLISARAFGWKNMFYVRRNVASARTSKDELPEETLQIVREHNALDLELYAYAQQLFEQMVAQQGRSFVNQVQRFQRLNSYFEHYYTHYYLKYMRPALSRFRSLLSGKN